MCNLYLRYPTIYSKYLRLVLQSWIANANINIRNVVPDKEDLNVEDSDEEEDTPRVSISEQSRGVDIGSDENGEGELIFGTCAKVLLVDNKLISCPKCATEKQKTRKPGKQI